MAFWPDVLDAMGKTPRELGRYHLHVEPVTRLPSGRAGARLWLQAAFDTAGERAFLGIESGAGPVLPEPLPLPPVEGAAVVLWELPLRFEPAVAELRFVITSSVPDSATRRRQAWKLLDTWEAPKLSDMNPASSGAPGLNVGTSLLGTALMGGAGVFVSFNVGTTVPGSDRVKVHKAAAQPTGFVAKVVDQQAEIPGEPRVSVAWRPGEPIPEPPPLVVAAPRAPVKPMLSLKRCVVCGFEGRSEELERSRACPQCDTSW